MQITSAALPWSLDTSGLRANSLAVIIPSDYNHEEKQNRYV
ncbi:hypothetical protein Slin15195_G129300 [Septoria linicola]|uniref:Uncharacterized protein n=1 Tax=Septoria linicola TaxID=215465 RepID=A0A9Q9EQA5_9PEZI|nr:hypothetical protein Slin14017_G121830 [Septoria linicola]USW59611.1 hypothetical protein Slin15195_G129300 [Septoria linicola]